MCSSLMRVYHRTGKMHNNYPLLGYIVHNMHTKWFVIISDMYIYNCIYGVSLASRTLPKKMATPLPKLSDPLTMINHWINTKHQIKIKHTNYQTI